ncbi:MAG: ABC transporter substrate-binding protein [Chloroflexi bacterium]|nr:ABC transporter substrate-binding protein [Chloroflexota bacterium]
MKRQLLQLIVVVLLLSFVASACVPAAPAPTPTPTKAPVAAATPTPTKPPAATPTPANPVDQVELKGPVEIVYWHTWTGPQAKVQQALIDEFQKKHPNIKVKAEYAGNWTQIFQKVMAGIQAGSTPDLAVLYENQIANCAKAGVAVPLENYVASQKYGLSKESMADFFPEIVERFYFPEVGNKLFGFPFSADAFIMYYNEDMLKEAGVKTIPPKTWDEFLEACKAVKKIGKEGYAIQAGPSAINAIMFSFGGKPFSDDWKTTLYDQPAGVKTYELLQTIIKEKLGYAVKIVPTIGDDFNDFAAGKVAFVMRTAINRAFLKEAVKGKFKWNVALIPQAADNKKPSTAMFGPGFAIFKSTPEKQLAAWEFAKFWTSREATVQWAVAGDFVPLRKSAVEDPKFKEYLAADPVNRGAFDIMPYTQREMPNLAAVNEIRQYINNATEAVITFKKSPAEATKELTQQCNKLLAEKR